jgi:hypothetical protein
MDCSRLHPTSQHISALGIFIQIHSSGTHTGILHRSKGTLRILDLLWHKKLRSDLPDKDYACVIPSLLPEEENDVTGMCRLIESRNDPRHPQVIPYAFGPSNNTHFDTDGELILGDGIGLTCSTFVLTVFESARVPLANVSEWVSREGDEARHASLLELMANGIDGFAPPAEPEHIEKVRASLASIRVRPEEAAGAALSLVLPADFKKAESAGLFILHTIRTR